MLLNPDVQTRAQAEIDSVVGFVRLPVFEDRPSLPYLDAVLRETLRWHPAVPLGKIFFSCVSHCLICRSIRHSTRYDKSRRLWRLFYSARFVARLQFDIR